MNKCLNQLKFYIAAAVILTGSFLALFYPTKAQAVTRPLTFPVIGPSSFINDYNDIHNGQIHHAIDIMANKGQKLVAAVSGTITRVNYPEPDWGWSVSIQDSTGYTYNYLHMNDDNPGTNDGMGGAFHAYAADVRVGNPVAKGQLLGYVGDSGYSNGVSHLHFEMYSPTDQVLNPYDSLLAATHISVPVQYPALANEILPYGGSSANGANIAMGNIDGDPAQEFVTGRATKGTPLVKVFDDNGTLLHSFYAYDSSFTGGIDVAMGDVNGDGVDEIITSPLAGHSPDVKIFKADGTLIDSFYAYPQSDMHGLHVAAGDVDGDGLSDEIITGWGSGASPTVKVFKADGTQLLSFSAYGSTFTGGVDVAAGDLTGLTSAAEIVTGTLSGGGQVRIFDPTGHAIKNLAPYGAFKGGVRVAVGNVRSGTLKSELLTIPASAGPPLINMYDSNWNLLRAQNFIEKWWVDSYDVAAGDGISKATTGWNRRASIRAGVL